ncbi:DUF4214 domain-containing protein [Duganella sp. LjRoot269]|uniref:DUF4214 domain-containing protein n=1 Tax=Duganella sp. LjRoot269 TaxID=3342305 RepID=UPI003ED1222B
MLMGHAPDTVALSQWMTVYNQGATLAQLAGSIYASGEAKTHRANSSNTAVQQMFQAIGQPLPSDPGYAAAVALWASRLDQAGTTLAQGQVIRAIMDGGMPKLAARANAVANYLVQGGGDADVVTRLLAQADSAPDGAIAEGSSAATTETQHIQLARLYLALFGRAPDKTGFDFWANALASGFALQSVALNMLQDAESLDGGLLPALTPDQYNERLVNLAYQNLLGRAPTAAELAAEKTRLGAATPPSASQAGFLIRLADQVASDSSSDPAAQAARAMLFNKVTVSLAYAAMPSTGMDTAQIIAANKAAIAAMTTSGNAAAAAHQATLYLQTQALMALAAVDATKQAASATPLETLRLQLARIYSVVLNRAPDTDGFAFWMGALKTGDPGMLRHIVDDMLTREGSNSALYPAGMTDLAFVTRVFTLGLGLQQGSAALTSAIATWVPRAAGANRSQLILDIINAVVASSKPDEQAMRNLLNNRASVGITYALNFAGNDLGQGQAILALVTGSDITAAIQFGNANAVQAAVDAALATVQTATSLAAQTAAVGNGLQQMVNAQVSLAPALAAANANAMAAPLMRATQLYIAMLMRGAPGQPALELGGVTTMAKQMLDGATDVAMAQSVLDSNEGRALFPRAGYNPTQFVSQIYRQALGRDPATDPDGVAYWTAAATTIDSRASVIVNMLKAFLENPVADSNPNKVANQLAQAAFYDKLNSALTGLSSSAKLATDALATAQDADTKAKNVSTTAAALSAAVSSAASTNARKVLELSRLYVGVLNRGAPGMPAIDIAGLNFWTMARTTGTTVEQVANGFIEDNKSFFPTDNTAFVNQIYQQVWGRTPGPEGNKWILALINGTKSRGVVAAGIIAELTDTTLTAEGDFRIKATFDDRVAQAMQVVAATAGAGATAAQTDLDKKAGIRKDALDLRATKGDAITTANGLTVDGDQAVKDALVVKSTGLTLKNSSQTKEVTELLVALRQPADFNAVYSWITRGQADDDLLRSIFAATNLFGPAPTTDPATQKAFVINLYKVLLDRTPNVDPGTIWPDGNYWYRAVRDNFTPNKNSAAFQEREFYRGAIVELYNPSDAAHINYSKRKSFQVEFNTANNPNLAEAQRRIDAYDTARQDATSRIAALQTGAATAYRLADEAYTNADGIWATAFNVNEAAKVAGIALTAAAKVQAAAVAADNAAADSLAANARMAGVAASVGLQAGSTLADYQTLADAALKVKDAAPLDASLMSARAALSRASAVHTTAVQSAATTWQSQYTNAVAQIYTALLKRSPTFLELNQAMGSLKAGKTVDDVANAVIAANPTLYPKQGTNDAFATKLYTQATGHGPDTATLRALSDPLTGGASRGSAVVALVRSLSADIASTDSAAFTGSVAANLSTLAGLAQQATTVEQATANVAQFIQANSANAQAEAAAYDAAHAPVQATGQYATELTRLYLVLLGRSPEPAALASAVEQRKGGTALKVIVKSILDSAETQLGRSLGNYDFITALYRQVMGRAPTDGEANLALAKLSSGLVKREDLVLSVLDDLDAYNGSDAAILTARTSLANRVSTSLERSVADVVAYGTAAQVAAQRSAAMETSALLARMADATPVLGRDSGAALAQQATVRTVTTLDRWGNVLSVTDPRDQNYQVSYRYNYNNQLIDQTVNALAGSTNVAHTASTYDALGRLTSTTDALGNTSRYEYDAAGNVTREIHADNGIVSYAYNLFGERVSVTTTRGAGLSDLQTNYAYDHLGHLTDSWSQAAVVSYVAVDPGQRYMQAAAQAAAQLRQHYVYDELGRNIGSSGGAGGSTTTSYDLDGNVIRTTDAAGNQTLSAYDAFHHRSATLDANGNRLNWTVDSWGQVAAEDNSGSSATAGAIAYSASYRYDAAGRKIHQGSSSGQDLDYGYTDGLLTTVRDNALGMTTRYGYDQAGNRLSERQAYDNAATAPARVQNNLMTYDWQNRLATVGDGVYAITYTYDNNGNRTRVHTVYDGITVDTYNSYDSMNRQLVVNGAWVGDPVTGHAVHGATGHTIAYDWAGNRVSDTYQGFQLGAGGDATAETVERYGYDGAGRLSEIRRDGVLTDTRRYDQFGHLSESGLMTDDDNVAHMLEAAGIATQRHVYSYDNLGHLIAQRDNAYVRDAVFTSYRSEAGLLQNIWFVGDGNGNTAVSGYDKVGNLVHYTISPAGTAPAANPEYKVTFSFTDGYREATNKELRSSVVNVSAYDANGNKASLTEQGKGTPKVRYWYDADGRVQSKVDSTSHFSLIVNGQVLGEEDKVATHVLGSIYTGVTSAALTAPPASYSVQGNGETLQSIAQAVWGDSKLWYLIADANGLDSSAALKAGDILRIPARVNTVHNDYATFRPYDAADALGNSAPAMPAPSHGGGCGSIGTLIMVVIAVAVTIYTAGALSGATANLFSAGLGVLSGAGGFSAATVAYAAAGGAAGSIASQVVGNAIGAQDGFSWKGVALSAVAAGASAGIGGLAADGAFGTTLAGTTSLPSAAGRAALSNVAAQGVGMVTGLQNGFSWRNVAAAATGALAGAAAGAAFGQALGSNSTLAAIFGQTNDLAVRTVSGFAAGATASILRGGKIAVAQIATDAFGNALGSSLAANSSGTPDLSTDKWDKIKQDVQNGARTASLNGPGSPLRPWSGDGEIMQDFDPNERLFKDDYAYDNRSDIAFGSTQQDADPTMQRVVIPGKRLSPEEQESWYKYQMRASMPDFGRSAPVVNSKAKAPSSKVIQRWNDTKQYFVDASIKAKVDVGTVVKIANFESSGFRSDARPISFKYPEKNTVKQFDGVMAMSSAYGFGQFTDDTWTGMLRQNGANYGIDNADSLTGLQAAGYRKDVKLQAAMLAEFTKDNISLGRRIGGTDDDANVYALHNLGTPTGTKFLNALVGTPDASVSTVLRSNIISGNQSLYGDGSISLKQAYERMGNVMRDGNVFADEARILLNKQKR